MSTNTHTQSEDYDRKAINDHFLQTLEFGCFNQAGDLYHELNEEAKARLINYIVTAMEAVPHEIQVRQISHFINADQAYGKAVAKELGIDTAKIKPAIRHLVTKKCQP